MRRVTGTTRAALRQLSGVILVTLLGLAPSAAADTVWVPEVSNKGQGHGTVSPPGANPRLAVDGRDPTSTNADETSLYWDLSSGPGSALATSSLILSAWLTGSRPEASGSLSADKTVEHALRWLRGGAEPFPTENGVAGTPKGSLGVVWFKEGASFARASVGMNADESAKAEVEMMLNGERAGYVSVSAPKSATVRSEPKRDPESGWNIKPAIKHLAISQANGAWRASREDQLWGRAQTTAFGFKARADVWDGKVGTGIVYLAEPAVGANPARIDAQAPPVLNEYCYSEYHGGFDPAADPPYVALQIPAEAVIAGGVAEADTHTEIKKGLDFAVTRALPDAIPHVVESTPSVIYPSYPDQPIERVGAGLERHLAFGGVNKFLPASNRTFGLNKLAMTFQGANVVGADFEAFFLGAGTRHPAGGPMACSGNLSEQTCPDPDVKLPNWAYYYSQEYQPVTIRYIDFGESFYRWTENWGDSVVYIGHAAFVPHRIPLYYRDPTSGKIAFSGWFCHVYGLLAYVDAVAHENSHKRQYALGYYTKNRALDSDGDTLKNLVEIRIGLNPNDPDTTGSGDRDGDPDVLAAMDAYGAVKQNQGLWRYDWAWEGVQHQIPGDGDRKFFPYHYCRGTLANHTVADPSASTLALFLDAVPIVSPD